MTELRTYTVEEVRKIIMGSPVKSCALDPIPTFLLREVIDALLPFLTAMCNASLQEGHLPVSQRHGIVLRSRKRVLLIRRIRKIRKLSTRVKSDLYVKGH